MALGSGKPWAAATAVALVVIANLLAFEAERNGVLYSSIPRQMIESAIEEMVHTDEYWFIGNSTLAAGLDTEQLEGEEGVDWTSTRLGSATLAATTRLGREALAHSDAGPRALIFVFTKDDLNENGARGVASREYFTAMEPPGFEDYLADALPLHSTRYAVVRKAKGFVVDSMLKRRGGHGHRRGGEQRERPSEPLPSDIDTTYLANLGRDFAPSIPDFTSLSELADERGTCVLLVAAPVGAPVAAWQARNAPAHPWPALVESLRRATDGTSVHLVDFSSLIPSETRYFRDPYHLKHEGSVEFTRALLSQLRRPDGPCGHGPPPP